MWGERVGREGSEERMREGKENKVWRAGWGREGWGDSWEC